MELPWSFITKNDDDIKRSGDANNDSGDDILRIISEKITTVVKKITTVMMTLTTVVKKITTVVMTLTTVVIPFWQNVRCQSQSDFLLL